MNDVADIKLAEADHAVDRRGYRRIIELGLSSLDGGLIGVDGRFGRIDLGLLQIDVLLGLETLERQGLKSRQVLLRCDQLRFVLALFCDRLVERGFEWRRIDLGERVALMHLLALAEIDRDDLAVDLSADGDRVKRLDRSQRMRI